MKKVIAITAFLALVGLEAISQVPAGFQKASLTLANNEQLEGTIKEGGIAKGTVQFEGANGSKKNYSAAELNALTVNGENYLALSNDFYKVLVNGKASLLQKQSDNSGKMLYNGSEANIATTTEGKIGEWYLHNSATGDLHLLGKKNFDTVLGTALVDCPAFLADLKAKLFSYDQLVQAVTKYNQCK
ncbi:MAG: hypothetical protein B7Y15_09540 [Bacteroidetes bacterium 24-39-8]|jgi:hypothetical protein|nr:MAG: hypothetical protein B7Y69_03000 [Sphingobacteriia bacterium 35-40-8]OYZ50003.1 MAG: hypothetical protein B7Y15_09540 [Bacteroidetes bacterium 24-39-8]OZA67710.1 MAG: hypothetical protein B7X72_03200 [Sphingobacteriia bacterium 39-39-8]HQR92707.1 hypothetical protein [Sediminibacterium sp.]HQS53846.1 hypothetical protein [Sediminibacterium sp.]